MRASRALVIIGMILLAAACSRKEPDLIKERGQQTPDEFGILPGKPIEIPDDLAALPPPDPGGVSRTDPTPEADAVAALGGNPRLLATSGEYRGEQGIMGHSTRFGVQSDIRETLAAEDQLYRERNRGRLFERWFNVTTYYSAYERQSLNQYNELQRYRSSGVPTPAAPPSTLGD